MKAFMVLRNKKSRQTVLAQAGSALIAAIIGCNAFAVDAIQIKDIRIEGLQRVEPGTVFATIPLRVGDQYTEERGAAAIRSLYGLGLFKDVRLEVKGDELILLIEERPNIANVDFIGTKEFDKDTLKKALKDIGLSEGRPFDKSLADKAEQELKRQYVNRSLYGAEVVTTVTPIDRNRVNLSFSVVEGELAKIKEIRIVGNKNFDDSTLLGLFDQNSGNWMSWYTKSDRYSRVKLNADLETLRSWYLNHGYLEFRIDSSQVAISPDRQGIDITINVTEGNKYTVSEVALEGFFLGKEEEFQSMIEIKPGKPYNAEDVTKTTKAFNEYFGDFGFAFARTEVRPEIDRVNNLVKLVLVADPSRRAYVRRINILGNNRTRDQIVRREMRQMESSWYDGAKIRLSRDRINRLGFFKEAEVETQEVPGTQDQVDLNVNVTEKPTGMLTVGAGFSSAEKMTLMLGIQQDNVLGTGQNLGIQINTSKYNKYYVISTTDPYYTENGVSRTFEFYHRDVRPYVAQLGYNDSVYHLLTTGLGLRFGVPVSEYDKVFVGASFEQTELRQGDGVGLLNVHRKFCASSGCRATNIPITIGWSRDDRDNFLNPNSGVYKRLNSEIGLIGDDRYIKNGAQYQKYVPLTKKYTFAFNAELGLAKGLQGNELPFYKNYYSGGLGSVRGYQIGSLGPRDDSTNANSAVIGGAKKINLNAEFLMPFPGAGNDRSLRLYGFYDAGNVLRESDPIRWADMRTSAGFGLSWVSPMGPLRFAWANPLRKFEGDRIQKFQFQIGNSF